MMTLTQRLPAQSIASISATLYLTAEERTQSRLRIERPEGNFLLCLPRGTVLRDGDLLGSEGSSPENYTAPVVRVVAKAEPVMTVTATQPLDLLRAAYHLGNRHVPLEITPSYLKFSADPVLKSMVEQLGLQVSEDLQPFQPEAGAYGQHGHEHRAHGHPSNNHDH